MGLRFTVYSLRLQLIAFIILFSLGCNKKNNWKKTDTGLQYKIFEDKGGSKAKVGDALQLHLIYRNGSDSVLYDSKFLGDAFIFELTDPPFKGSLEEGFTMMGEGDSAAFLVTADSVYKNVFQQTMPAQMPHGSKLRIDVKINKLLTPSQYKALLRKQEKSPVWSEDELISKYMSDNQLSAIQESSGLYFISFVDGTGNQPQAGDDVEVSYLVRSLNGEVYDASEKGYRFKMGDTTMVKGWNEGISKMREGGKARFIVPSKLGYGIAGNGQVPSNATLVFDVDLIKIHQHGSL